MTKAHSFQEGSQLGVEGEKVRWVPRSRSYDPPHPGKLWSRHTSDGLQSSLFPSPDPEARKSFWDLSTGSKLFNERQLPPGIRRKWPDGPSPHYQSQWGHSQNCTDRKYGHCPLLPAGPDALDLISPKWLFFSFHVTTAYFPTHPVLLKEGRGKKLSLSPTLETGNGREEAREAKTICSHPTLLPGPGAMVIKAFN